MINRFGSVTLLCATLVTLGPQPAAAQAHPPCPPAPKLETSATSVETKTAVDAVSKLLAKFGVDVNIKTTRDSILKGNPDANQTLVVLTMAATYCEMIWSDSSLSGAEKAKRYQASMKDILSQVLGPVPVARTKRTTPPNHSRLDGQGGALVLASADPSAMLLVAQDEPAFTLPEPQTGFLRDAPFYVTDANKYFVMVGSAATKDEGIRLMNKLKAKAPQYDFVLYAPYGANTYYAVMMATWVPKDVAKEALRLAQRDVARDAIIWACRSSGDSC